MISDLISRRNPSAVASATAGSRPAPTPTPVKTSQTYYHRNQQYSIVGLTNAAGTLVERYTYSAYGTLGIYAANGTVRSSSTYANRYTYTGREWDADLRLYHFRARWFDPATGGFVSRDPLGYVDGLSLYRGYFGVRGVDPSGRLRRLLDAKFLETVHEECRGTNAEVAADVAAVEAELETVRSPMLTKECDCEYQWRMALSRNGIAYRQWMYLVEKGCNIKVHCWSCRDLGFGTITSGGYSFGKRAVILCMDNIQIEDYGVVLAHELTHANQHCSGEFQEDCGTQLFLEMEAYYCEGACGRNMSPEQAAEDCALRAVRSVCAAKLCDTEKLTPSAVQQQLDRFKHYLVTGQICTFSQPRMPQTPAETADAVSRRVRR